MNYSNATVRGNAIHQTLMNESKCGAYYTETNHCSIIGELLKFPDDEVCVLEPSIGDGSAVKAVTKKEARENVKIFGVELRDVAANEVRKDPLIEECLCADFTNGVTIKNNAFTLCFGNPPYMDDDDTEDGKRGRLERTFLEKVTGAYLKKGGILVWVIPYSRFVEESTLKYLISHYEFLQVYKFREDEYKKWKQIVFIGRKTDTRIPLAAEIAEVREKYKSDDIVPVLPMTFEGTDLYESIEVYPSKSADITYFAAKEFDPRAALAHFGTNPDLDDYHRLIGKRSTQKEYASTELGAPPIPLKKDSLYLMATSGVGQGLAGTLGKDMHLQRGVAEVVEEVERNSDPNKKDGSGDTVTVTTRAKVTMSIIETCGEITVLE